MISRIKNNNFGVFARIRSLPDTARELRRRLLELVELIRDENGCLSCEMIENSCDPTEFTLLQEWSLGEDHSAHFVTDRIRNAMKCFPSLLTTELDLRKHVLRLNSIKYGTNSYCLAAG
jgi:quinol monooxygenase YgiN